MAINPNAIIVFDGNVKASQLDALKYFRGDVVIHKHLIVDGDLSLRCNLYVFGKIFKKKILNEHNISINGNLYCNGEMTCNDIDVHGNLFCEGDIYSQDIKVGGDFVCYGKVDAYNHYVVVAGDIISSGLVAQRVEYLGDVNVDGLISVANGMKSYR